MSFRLSAITLTAIASLTASGWGAPDPILSLSDLKSLQANIKQVSKKVMPATVSVFSAKNGASGSGVIVSKDGLILTAGHVVRGAEEMTVIFPDGSQAKGKVLGANYTRDAAMIQITDKGPWPYAPIGHSGKLKTGDPVIALGHAGGYDPVRTPPVRFGRVISTDRQGFINTDCTLIGGDSGGPLFDLQGRVIAIHSSIGYSHKINNHSGIDGFRKDWDKLKSGETWGRLGSSSLDDPDNPVIGIFTAHSRNGGVVITNVIKGGPAFKAGLRGGDIIRSINGNEIRNQRRLSAIIFQFKPGDTVKIRVTRGEDSLTRNVTIGRKGDLQ
ncbi:trypsin-like peptidase domain-containing protein [Verrucomicrobiaceae bacterium N1E253]|uniref:Trypsin-like peptidase domain-containing protein n=1 Tax=Oceaniferula marina TaxID=2748318 RepID=A0A851GEK0_9BACT|nr:trypsin-like peptidase domain-containing protein [Oceaniferula marina]NWK55332.1 trypsin-like peptidase domain-containing protein [Oceaniferula marina]